MHLQKKADDDDEMDVDEKPKRGRGAAKKDAPSGTALELLASMRRAGYERGVDVSSTRAGAIPGTHTLGFDGASETITLTHTSRDRSIFARGALEKRGTVHAARQHVPVAGVPHGSRPDAAGGHLRGEAQKRLRALHVPMRDGFR